MGSELTVPVESSLAPPVDEDIGLQVIERLAVGRSLSEIAAIPGMPSSETFLIWLIQSPALAQAFEKARQVSSYALEEEALGLLRRNNTEALGTAKNKAISELVQQLRWSAEKRNPATYSRQSAVNVQIPVQINTSLDLGENKAGGGTSEFPNIYELKASVDTPTLDITERKRALKRTDTPEARAARAEQRRRMYAKKKKGTGADGGDSSNA